MHGPLRESCPNALRVRVKAPGFVNVRLLLAGLNNAEVVAGFGEVGLQAYGIGELGDSGSGRYGHETLRTFVRASVSGLRSAKRRVPI